MQSHDFHSVTIRLFAWMCSLGFPYTLESCELAMSNAAAKLAEYVDGDKQPALELFKALMPFWSSSAASAAKKHWTATKYRTLNVYRASGKFTLTQQQTVSFRRIRVGLMACDARTIASVSCTCPAIHDTLLFLCRLQTLSIRFRSMVLFFTSS